MLWFLGLLAITGLVLYLDGCWPTSTHHAPSKYTD